MLASIRGYAIVEQLQRAGIELSMGRTEPPLLHPDEAGIRIPGPPQASSKGSVPFSSNRTRRFHRIGQLLGLACACLPAASARAAIEVNVTHAGFPGISPASDVYRYGVWVPIIVDLALIGQPAFDGFVRTSQSDADGDACVDSVEVHLRAESGGAQRVYLYSIASPNDRDRAFQVELRSSTGELVQVISEGAPTFHARPVGETQAIGHDEWLILSVSTGTVGRLTEFVGFSSDFAQPIYLAHVGPADLPELAIGLESVDFVIWDDARPESLTQRQLQALIEWVRKGGTLFVAAGQSAGLMNLSTDLGNILPAEIGDVLSVENLTEVRRALLGEPKRDVEVALLDPEWLNIPFRQPAPVVQCRVRDDARVVAREPSIESDLVTRRREGRGHVIFAGVALRDLLSAPGELKPMLQRLFHLPPLQDQNLGRATPESIFDQIASAVSFSASGTLYLLLAALFSIGYVAAATYGLWAYLGSRGWRKHSWTAFAVAGVVAGFLSVFAVGAVRGIGDRLHQVTIVDLDSGSRQAYATAYFGIKSGIDKRMDVWLPDDWIAAVEPESGRSSLRPMPASSDSLEMRTRFADPTEYRLGPAGAMVEDIRLRATLKRFEGRWAGPTKGSVHGQIRTLRRRITDDSFIVNDLGVDLKDCLLLVPVLSPDEVARDGNAIHAYAIGNLPTGPGRIALADRMIEREGPDQRQAPTLKLAQMDWSRSLGRTLLPGGGSQFNMGQERNALLLASTIGDFDPKDHPGRMTGMFGMRTWGRDRLRQFDLRSTLVAGRPALDDRPAQLGEAVLIGFADDPGPLRLFTRTGDRPFRVLEPEMRSSWSMYRVRIPLTVLGTASAEADEPPDTTGP